jgi:transcriptional regulator with XRE-family HTH domain
MEKNNEEKTTLQNLYGEVLKKARTNTGISQEKLALETGLDRTYISLLERGLRTPSLYTIMLLSNHLSIKASSMVADVEATYSADNNK